MKTKPVVVECPLCCGKATIRLNILVDELEVAKSAWHLRQCGASYREIARAMKFKGNAPQIAKHHVEKWIKWQKTMSKENQNAKVPANYKKMLDSL